MAGAARRMPRGPGSGGPDRNPAGSALDKPSSRSRRLAELDIARSAALAAMAVFHLAWDLTMFGFLPEGTMLSPFWTGSARAIAGSFLFLSGASLWLAHGTAIRWHPFLRRLALLALAAAAISVVTWLAMPGAWIRFGILHAIAVSSCIGLLFLRAPLPLLAAATAGILLLARLELPGFGGPLWLWSGLGSSPPRMLDYAPLVPWLAAFLAGLLSARVCAKRLSPRLDPAVRAVQVLSWPGRHSLAVYLLHQPVLFGAVFLARRATDLAMG
ncbi:heparan-alpha-glucosaminide N-acetyltransferase [Mangrovicoccus ximenensis]|uniref:heparan-alpha-glucosaminide N-acetyltransferase n=1 Tax=Mangrovicoccus ximenensis TaxID=1911570 RepID=UPI0013752383|nr:heparan-alpha-glucosaminide N-acetyltransferase [Mangrovicoccus ximenensis]